MFADVSKFADNVGMLCGFWYNGRFRTGRIELIRDGGLVTVKLDNRKEGEPTHKAFYVHKMGSPAVYA
jgi:hypothetical protein